MAQQAGRSAAPDRLVIKFSFAAKRPDGAYALSFPRGKNAHDAWPSSTRPRARWPFAPPIRSASSGYRRGRRNLSRGRDGSPPAARRPGRRSTTGVRARGGRKRAVARFRVNPLVSIRRPQLRPRDAARTRRAAARSWRYDKYRNNSAQAAADARGVIVVAPRRRQKEWLSSPRCSRPRPHRSLSPNRPTSSIPGFVERCAPMDGLASTSSARRKARGQVCMGRAVASPARCGPACSSLRWRRAKSAKHSSSSARHHLRYRRHLDKPA